MDKRVLIIRHAETAWNVAGRWQGHMDVPLNETGHQQAIALANYLRDEPIQRIYTSDLQRARQTAQHIADRLAIPLIADERLRELNVGVFGGLTKPEIQEKYAHEWAQMQKKPLDYVYPEGEARADMVKRFESALEEITVDIEQPIAIVTHGGAIANFMRHKFPRQRDLPKIRYKNTSISTLRKEGHHWVVDSVAMTPHLR